MALDIKNIKLDSVMKLSLSRKLIILAIIHLVFIGLYYQFLYRPKTSEIAKLRGDLATLETKIAESRRIAADIPKFERKRQELEVKLKEALTQLPNKREIPSLIQSISSAAQESGLDIVTFKPLSERVKGFYAEVPVSMKVSGEFENLYRFYMRVEAMPRIVNISGLNIKSKTLKDQITLSADFQATTFRFVERSEGDSGKKKKKKKKRKK